MNWEVVISEHINLEVQDTAETEIAHPGKLDMAAKTVTKSTRQRAGKRVPKKAHSKQPDTCSDEIATAAYFKAERRGFVPGRELADWLEAEDEILTRP